jgi:hypothetical protein
MTIHSMAGESSMKPMTTFLIPRMAWDVLFGQQLHLPHFSGFSKSQDQRILLPLVLTPVAQLARVLEQESIVSQ